MDARMQIENRLTAIASEKDALASKLDNFKDEIRRLEAIYDAFEKEEEELRTALSVFKRFEPRTGIRRINQRKGGLFAKPERHRVIIPPHAPKNVSSMIEIILTESPFNRLTALEILAEIQKRWLPDLKRTSLSPSLSRMGKRGALLRDGHVWRLP